MRFCGNDSSFDLIIDGNLSPCFFYSVSSTLVACFLLFTGVTRGFQLAFLKNQEHPAGHPSSSVFRRGLDVLVIACAFLEFALALAGLVYEVTASAEAHGYLVMANSLMLAVWLLMAALMILEKMRTGVWQFFYRFLVYMQTFFMLVELSYMIIRITKLEGEEPTQDDWVAFGLFFARFLVTLCWCASFLYLSKAYKHDYILLPQEPNEGANDPFKDFWKKLRKLSPFIWPQNDRYLQFLVVWCFILLLAARVVNVFVPLYLGIVVDQLSGENGPPTFPLGDIFLYIFLRFLQGGAGGSIGFLTNLRSYFWIRVEQYTTREVSVDTFRHLHALSLRYHLQRKTGEVLRVIDRGTTSISSLLSALVFNILPTFLDIGIAVGYFVGVFDIYFGLIVFVAMVSYMFITVVLTEWRTKFRRVMIETDNDARQKAVDSLINFETVKYYGAESYEVKRYRGAILSYQEADWESQASLVLLNTIQNVVIVIGLLAGTLLAAHQVVEGQLTIGDFTMFLTYMTQLYAPLNWLGTYYRSIQQNFIDMEKMLSLFEEHVEIQDDPKASDLVVTKGVLTFDDVSFSYEGKNPALTNISFEIPAGQTYALVGSSGGGKSTVMRLCFRFYDVTSGSIKIDGVDIRTVTQASLRKAIGVVPQDTVLFNDTIKYNISYGNLNCTEEEVVQAAKAAQIHEKILTFHEGYETKVGERGLRLSGGEKQRVAIARTLLKNPKIVLLDEATSALDTETERQIQESLAKMSENRTTLVVAHRLSTIINADQILVMMNGTIVERGTHEELLQMQGEYANLWQKQLESNKSKEQAEAEKRIVASQGVSIN